MPPIILPAQMGDPKWRKDDSVTLTLVTSGEISDEQFLHLSKYRKLNGWFEFVANKIDLADVPESNAPIKYGSSRAKRLRDKIYVLHTQRGGRPEEFDAYYERKMNEFEQLIDDVLD